MSIIYEKWRDLSLNINKINFKNFKIKEIISYPPAGNDVVEFITENNDNYFIKIERSKMADFESEYNNINLINKYYNKIPKTIENGVVFDKKYIVLTKIEGLRISDLIESGNYKEEYLYKYGKELATIHKIPGNEFNIAKQRVINDYPKDKNYSIPDEIKKYIQYLKDNKPNITYNTFIHGDFHYANVLFENDDINGVIDWEYSGKGFKEQDIAWFLILRPCQKFMNKIEDINKFLEGYKSVGSYNLDNLKWCLINGYCHFYLMNTSNIEYKNEILKLLRIVENVNC